MKVAQLSALALFLAAPGATSLAATAPLVPQEEIARAFREKFEKAMTIKDRNEMKSLVNANVEPATTWVVETAELLATAPSEAVYARMAALREAWKAAIGTDFCDKMERYFSFLDGPSKRERVRLKRDYVRANQAYYANLQARDAPTFTGLAVQFVSLGGAFVQISDYYFASQCYGFAGAALDEENLGKKADLKQACENYRQFLEYRQKVGLEDNLYAINKSRHQTLVALGFGNEEVPVAGGEEEGGEVAGPPEGGKEGAPSQPAGPITMDLSFEVVDDLTAFERPSYFLDEIYQIWNGIYLTAKGSNFKFPRLDPVLTVYREGAGEVKIDADRDGTGDTEMPLRGRLEPVVFEIGEGAARRKWAVLTATGLEKDDYQGFEANLGPTDLVLNIYYAPAASMVGDMAGTSIRVFDDNLDGVYGSLASTWQHIGLSKGRAMPEMDSMLIGEGKHAQPWSEYVQVGASWYRLESANGGTSLTATPVEPKTGKLILAYKGGVKPSYVIVRGSNDYQNSYFDLSSGKPVDVPLGRYELFFGLVTKGKKRQVMKSIILPGEGTKSYDVLDGGTVEVELGAPFRFDFAYDVEGDQITVHGDSVVVIGVGGERYERNWKGRPEVEVSYRKAGSARGSKPESMPLIMEQNQADELGWDKAWFPLDLVLEKRPNEKEIEVQLTEKANKLFGKIESVWK